MYRDFSRGWFSPNLLSLTILGCKQLELRFAMWHLHKLTSLKDLIVGDFDRDMVSFAEDFTIPPNLVHLQIQSLPKLKSISEGLLNLISRKALDVWNCPNLQCLPEKGLPITLDVLQIRNCPLLEEECRNEKGHTKPLALSHRNLLVRTSSLSIASLIIFDPKEMVVVLLKRSYT
ncbi:Disease resistance protein [Gossypium australe]|uniref:Disease resistance protein n=1 Tax=Gossypium australe TaxID=47621 RepID=A0A5B6VK40_9ROSI|nr:Disease resistance protein [Gossypium australe]